MDNRGGNSFLATVVVERRMGCGTGAVQSELGSRIEGNLLLFEKNNNSLQLRLQ